MLRLKTFGTLAIHRDGSPAEGAGAQRRRLALLALLAASGDRGMSRESLHGFLWAESDLERAQKHLAQAVSSLRRDLASEDVILGTADLRLNPEFITSDIEEFHQAIADGRLEDALSLYQGPFLDGIYLDEAPEFEQWAELERATLARELASVLEQLAAQTEKQGDVRGAAGYWRRLANTDPLNAKVATSLMRALVAAGDRVGALQHFRVYEILLRQEHDLSPDAMLREFAEGLRRTEGLKVNPDVGLQLGAPLLPNVPVSTIPGTPAVARPSPTAGTPYRALVPGLTFAPPRPIVRYGIAIGILVGLVVIGLLLVNR